MRLRILNEDKWDWNSDGVLTDHKDMLASLFTDNPILSMALEPKEDNIEELEDELGDEIDQKSYG